MSTKSKNIKNVGSHLVDEINFYYHTDAELANCAVTVLLKNFTFTKRLKMCWQILFTKYNKVHFILSNEHHSTIQGVATYLKPKSTNKKAK